MVEERALEEADKCAGCGSALLGATCANLGSEDCDASRMWDGLPAALRHMSDEDWDGWAAGEKKSVADFKAVLRHAASLNLDDDEEDDEEEED